MMSRLAYFLALAMIASVAFVQIPLPGIFGTPSRVIGLLLLITWALTLPTRKGYRIPVGFHVAFFAFVVWNIVSLLWTPTFGIAMEKIQRYAQAFLASLILWQVLDHRRQVLNAYQALVIGALIAIGMTLLDYAHNLSVYASVGRYAAIGFDPNELGIQVVMTIAPAAFLLTSTDYKNPFLRIVNAAYPLAAIFAVFLGGSRSAVLASIPCLIYLLVKMRTLGYKGYALLGLTIVCAVAGISRFHLTDSIMRFAGIMSSASVDGFTGRLELWKGGAHLFLQHPVVGVGLGGFAQSVFPVVGIDEVAHSTFISVASELGTVGVILLLLVLGNLVALIAKSPRDIRWMSIVLLLSWAIGAASLSWEDVPQTWLVISLIACGSLTRDPKEYLERDQASGMTS